MLYEEVIVPPVIKVDSSAEPPAAAGDE